MRAPVRKASTTRRLKPVAMGACLGVAAGEDAGGAVVELVFTCSSVGLSLQVLTQSLNKARGLFHSYGVPLVPGSSRRLRVCILCRLI